MRAITFAFGLGVALAFSVGSTGACPEGDHTHEHARRAPPQAPLTRPSRPLVWGDVNIIHTTDSHGWLLGHQKPSFPEPNSSGDFGDFASFVAHMKKIADKKDVDLLLVDSGDLHDGTGLSDGFPPGGIDAHDVRVFPYTLPHRVQSLSLIAYSPTSSSPNCPMTCSPSETTNCPSTQTALDMHQNFAPKFPGRYLSSNVNITIPGPNGSPVSVPVGSRFAKFKTRKGRKVTSLGVLFDFTGNVHNTTVQKVEDMVKEAWFADAIKDEPDFFLLVGHMPVARDNWPLVFNAVRAVHPTTPILILGGHTHIRDCLQFDGRSIALESGRYMETLGFLSVDLDHRGSTRNLTVNRRYLDPNRVTYEYHTNSRDSSFDTSMGRKITEGLKALAAQFDLDFKFGTAPQDYTLSRDPFPSNGSLLSLIADQVLPAALTVNNTRANIPKIIITNSGGLRFDIYAGPFTKNDQLTASPFTDAFVFIAGVPLSVASAVLPALNGEGANERRELAEAAERYARGDVETRYRFWLEEMYARAGPERRAAQNLTLGYVTKDACPGVGDDTLHTPLPFFGSPDFIGSTPPAGSNDTAIDLVFVDFIGSQVVQVLNKLQTAKTYTSADITSYTPILLNEVLGVFAEAEWN
ncbi:Metallo-dependent phosphatase-like protein [Lactarius akahatsu]|uniref:Metallo-dependent phosphatase-like protein n=1 Tax=Lactarius akahatsu TaxID=416441 RepID=A0AAD4QA90_9AGAM|nr:Metallo-dependent phosphatase-like protein [Lactarius akahatsu]